MIDELRNRIAMLPMGLRLALVAATAALIAAPVAVSKARSPGYRTSIDVFALRKGGIAPSGSRVAWVRRLLRDPHLATETVQSSGLGLAPDSLAHRIHAFAAPSSVLVTIEGDTPDDAVVLAQALELTLARASGRDLAVRARRASDRIERRLRAGGLRPVDRASLERRLRELRPLVTPGAPDVAYGKAPTRPLPTGSFDRFLDRLPGRFPARLDAGWAVFFGVVLSLLLWGVALALDAHRHAAATEPVALPADRRRSA